MATIDRMLTFVIESGMDHTNLGRLSWQLIGKGNACTRIVVAHQPTRPGKNDKGNGATCDYDKTVYSMQCLGASRNPICNFIPKERPFSQRNRTAQKAH